MNERLGIVLVLGGVLALVLAACGGGEATATPQPTRPPQPTATSAPVATPTPAPAATAAFAPAGTATPAPAATQAPRPTATAAPTATTAVTATVSGPQPKTGGVLHLRWYADFRQWDTWHANGGFTYPFTKTILSNLVQYQQGTFQIKGDLAESWDASADGKTYTFRIRKDAQWHDGKPVTAKDMLYNFKRGSDPAYVFNKPRVAPIATMDTPDDYTFKVTLKDVSNAFFPQIATPFVLMYPSHIDPTVWQKTAVGSGPFKFSSDKPNTAYEFTRSSNYYVKDAQGRQLPYLDGIVFDVIPDPALSLAAFVTGRIHCGCAHAETWVIRNEDKIRSEVRGVKLEGHLGTIIQLEVNGKKPPFDNLAFRQGVAIGLDKEKVAATYAFGKTFRPAPPLVPPQFGGQWALPKDEMEKIPGFAADHAADVRAANAKFQQSGVDPKKVKLDILSNQVYADLMDLLASVMSTDLGIPTTVTISGSTAELNERRMSGNFLIYLDSQGGVIDDPLDWYRDSLTTGGVQNFSGYSNGRVDELLRIQDTERDPAKRKQLVWELQRIQLTESTRIPILWPLGARATRPEVNNFKIGPLNLQNYDWTDIWLDK